LSWEKSSVGLSYSEEGGRGAEEGRERGPAYEFVVCRTKTKTPTSEFRAPGGERKMTPTLQRDRSDDKPREKEEGFRLRQSKVLEPSRGMLLIGKMFRKRKEGDIMRGGLGIGRAWEPRGGGHEPCWRKDWTSKNLIIRGPRARLRKLKASKPESRTQGNSGGGERDAFHWAASEVGGEVAEPRRGRGTNKADSEGDTTDGWEILRGGETKERRGALIILCETPSTEQLGWRLKDIKHSGRR